MRQLCGSRPGNGAPYYNNEHVFVFVFLQTDTRKEQILSNAHTHHYIPFTWMQLWLTVFSGSGEAKQVTANASRHSLEISLVLKYHNKYDTDRIQTTTLSVSTLMTKGPCDKLTKEGLFVFLFFYNHVQCWYDSRAGHHRKCFDISSDLECLLWMKSDFITWWSETTCFSPHNTSFHYLDTCKNKT